MKLVVDNTKKPLSLEFTERKQGYEYSNYFFANRYRIQSAPREIVLAAIAIKELNGFEFDDRGVTVGIVASRENHDDTNFILGLTNAMAEVWKQREWGEVRDVTYSGVYTANVAASYLKNDVHDALRSLEY